MSTISRFPKLHLEELDPRIVPATITWNNAVAPVGGDFNNPANWIGGVVPGANDTGVIDLNLDGQVAIGSGTTQVQGIFTDPNTTLRVGGTSKLIFSGGNSNFSGPVFIDPLATTTVSPGANVTIRNNVTFQIDGTLTLNSPGSFVVEETGDSTPQRIIVNGSFDATNADVRNFGANIAADPTRFTVNPGAQFRFVNSTFELEQLVLSNGSKVTVNGISSVTGSTFLTDLFAPADAIPQLTNNVSFQNVFINPDSLTIPNLTLAPLGTNSTNQQYIFPQSFVIPDKSLVTFANDSKIVIADNVTITVNGGLNVGKVGAFFVNELDPAMGQGMTVNGSLNVADAKNGFFIAAPNVPTDITRLQFGPDATFTAINSTFAWDQFIIPNETKFNAASLVGNAFDTSLFVAASKIPLITNNLRFQDVNINPGSTFDGVLQLAPIGTQTTANQRYVFPGDFTIGKSNGVIVSQGTRVLIRDGANITVDGTLRLETPGEFLIQEGVTGNAQGVTVNGVFDVTNTVFGFLGADNKNDKSQVVVNSGATFVHDGGQFQWDELRLQGGSKSRVQFISLTNRLIIDSAASQLISFNDFSAVGANSIIAQGSAGKQILIPNNFWGTTVDSQIEVRILDQADNPSLPDIVFQPVLSARPARPILTPAVTEFSLVDRSITLFADLSNPAGNLNEGTVTFRVFNGATLVGSPVTVNVVNGGATAQYVIPGGLPGGTYTVQAQFSGTGNFTGNTDTDTLTIQPARVVVDVAPIAQLAFTPDAQPVTLSASVTSPIGTIEQGMVRFTLFRNGVGVIVLGNADVVNGMATRTFMLPPGFSAGTYIVQATFLGNQNFTVASDQDEPLIILPLFSSTLANDVATRFSLDVQNVALSAMVTSPAGGIVNDGSVRFTVLSPQGVLGTPVSGAVVNGVATVNYTLPAGTGIGNYTIRAEYTGTNLTPSMGDSVLTIATAVSATTVQNATLGVQSTGSSVPLTATVTSDVGPVSVGTLTFTILNGTTPIGTPVTVPVMRGNATANYAIPTDTLPGNFVIRAVYSGTPFLAGSAAQGILTVQPVATSITINPIPTIPFNNNARTIPLTANVAAAGRIVDNGQVVFTVQMGNQIFGTPTPAAVVNGVANVDYTLPAGTPAGIFTVVAQYGSSGFFAPSTASSNLEIALAGLPGTSNSNQFAVGRGTAAGVFLFNPDGSTRLQLNPFANSPGGVRVATADFNGDGVADVVAGTGPGRPTEVAMFDGVTGAELFRVSPFEASYTGGVFVSAGDLNQDGIADIVVSPDIGGGPRVRIFSGNGFNQLADFFGIDDPNFRGGANTAIGDVNGDGVPDLVVAAGAGGGPRIATYDGTSLSDGSFTRKAFGDFFAFEQSLRDGAFVSVGDLNNDGFSEIVAGAGFGGAPRVSGFDGFSLTKSSTPQRIVDFFAGSTGERGGVRVAVKELQPDGANIIAGSGLGVPSKVTAYADGINNGVPNELFTRIPFPGFTDGVFVG